MTSLRGRRRIGGLIWGGLSLFAVGWALLQPDQTAAFPAMVSAYTVEVAAVETGRIQSVEVELHDAVAVGGIIARMDPLEARNERDIAAADFLAIVSAASTETPADQKMVRKRAEVLDLRAKVASLDRKVERLERLMNEGVASKGELLSMQAERTSVQRKLTEKSNALGLDTGSSNAWVEVGAMRRLEAAEHRLASLELRSALQGRVTAILKRPGEVVVRGEPIARVGVEDAQEAIVWVPPQFVPATGGAVTVLRANGATVGGKVKSVGPSTEPLPESMWKVPNRSESGVPVRVSIGSGALVGGEVVRVQLR